jgi:hypothetical protein
MADISTSDVAVNSEKKKRPATLTILALLLFMRVLLVLGLALLIGIGILFDGDVQFTADILALSVTLALLVVASITLAATWGLWSLKPWAWQLNMIIMGFLLLINIWGHFASVENRIQTDVTLALNIITVFYLIQGDVRDLFAQQDGESTNS